MTLSSLGAAHLAAACVALLPRLVVLLERKGTPAHRSFGATYVAAMIALNVTALGIYRLTGQFGPFHVLALISLAAVARGTLAVLRRSPGWLVRHYYNMAGSYLGLLAAACAEVVARVPPMRGLIVNGTRGVALGVAIAVLFVAIGLFVLPRLKARALADARQR